jgi:hypothetical protein
MEGVAAFSSSTTYRGGGEEARASRHYQGVEVQHVVDADTAQQHRPHERRPPALQPPVRGALLRAHVLELLPEAAAVQPRYPPKHDGLGEGLARRCPHHLD